MKLLISLLFATTIFAATPPNQPTTGPGGSTYSYASVTTYGIFNDGPMCSGVPCNYGLNYYIYQPGTPTPTSPLPLVYFLHGFSAESPSVYQGWINQIVQKGFTVVWVNWDNGGTVTGGTAVNNEVSVLASALARIAAGSYVKVLTDGNSVAEVNIVAHSGGAWTGAAVAAASANVANDIPPIRSLAAINPGQGMLPDYDISAINSNMISIVVVGDQENTCEKWVGAKLFDLLNSTSKTFYEVNSDSHGSPALVANHTFPVTSDITDDLDYNISWKLSVALVQCADATLNCSIALNDNTTANNMGYWSDSVAVTVPTQFTTDPELTFHWPGGTCTK